MKQERQYLAQSFFIALLMAAVMILPVVLYSGGYLVLYGDYNAQEVPFYKVCIRAVQAGSFGWNWETNLGANFIGSYSFYTLGSPFFWLAALFPADISQYLMAPLLVLKTAFALLFAFVYLRRFTKTPTAALIGSLLYAFSGFALANSVFFHFHEAICFFPLLLASLEEAVVCRRRGVFALCVALCALVNYFFFIGECVFLVLYFLARMAGDRAFRIKAGDFFCLAFESVVGVMLAGVLFAPSIAQVLSTGRANSLISGTDMLVYSDPATYLVILKSLLLPSEPFSKSYIFGSEQTKWRSAAAYLPMFSVAGVVAYLRSADKKNWIRLLITVCGIFALVPVLNSAFTLFNGEYYARWYYMAILILCLATVKALEEKSDWRTGCIVGMAGTLFMAAVYLFLPLKLEHSSGSTEYTTRLAHGWLRWEELLLIGAALVFCVLLIYLIRSRRKLSYEKFLENALSFTVIAAIVTGGIQFFLARLDGPVFNSYNKAVESNVTLPEGEFYRINTEEPMNYNMNWGYGSAQSFHSIIPQAVLDLHSAIGSDDAEVIVFRPSSDLAFDALTRTKYIAKAVTFEIAEPDEFYDREHFYHFVGKQGSFNIYETEQIVPMGCSYDSFCSVKDVTDIAEECDSAANLMLHSVALDEAAAEKYSDILTREVLSAEQLDAGQMKADIADRQSLAAQDFEITKQGFTARTDFPTDRIVVFSVAYAEGWSAEANGVPLEVDRANVGFLAVRVPAGEQELVFTYKAPALDLGIAMTTAGAAALAAYLIVIYAVLKKRPTKFFPPRQESGVSLHRSYITQQTQNNGDNEKHV